MKHTYPEVFSRLTFETAVVIFIKKDGSFRTMLATRNLNTAALRFGHLGRSLGGHDTRCNIKNGNVAVIDLSLGEARSFHIDRLVDIEFLGVVSDLSELDKAFSSYVRIREEYEKNMPKSIGMDML